VGEKRGGGGVSAGERFGGQTGCVGGGEDAFIITVDQAVHREKMMFRIGPYTPGSPVY
jgi:hypothetical protein